MSDGASRRLRRDEQHGLSVELTGIPGAGKSHCASALAAGLTDRGVLVHQPLAGLAPAGPRNRRRARKAAACGAAALGHPVTTARMARAVIASGQPAGTTHRVVQWLVSQHALATTRRRAGVGIVDEGLIHALWSIGLRGDVEPALRALAASPRACGPDLVVVVRVPPELALDRLVARASRHSRTQLLPESEGLAELRRGVRLLDHLVEWWARETPTPTRVLAVSGTDHDGEDRERALDRICTALEAIGPLRSESAARRR